MTDIHEQGLRKKLRFESGKGYITMEDLWDIPLASESRVSVNSLYVKYSEELKSVETVGLVSKPAKGSDLIRLKLEVLKNVYEVRTAEAAAAKRAAHDRIEKQELLADLSAIEKDERKQLGKAGILARLAELQ